MAVTALWIFMCDSVLIVELILKSDRPNIKIGKIMYTQLAGHHLIYLQNSVIYPWFYN